MTAGCPRPLRAKLGLAAGLVLAALVVTVGAAQARVSAPVVAKEREELIDRIDSETADGGQAGAERRRAARRRERTGSARRSRQHGGGPGATWWRCCRARPRCTGPGVKLVVDDAKDAEHGRRRGPAREQRLLRHRAGTRPGHAARRQRPVGVGRGGRRDQRTAADGAVGDQGRGRRHTGRQQAAGAAVHGAGGGGRAAAEHRVPGQRRRAVSARAAGELRHPHQHLRGGRRSGCRPRRA